MDFAVGDGDGPVAVVQVGVVAATDQDEILDLGLTAVDPGDQVMRVADDRRGSADDAAAVAGVQGAAHRAGDQAFAAADIEGFGV